MNIAENIRYYFWSSFQRKLLDKAQEKHRSIYKGIVLDIGGRDRGKFRKPKSSVRKWIFADICPDHHPDIVLDVANMAAIENKSIDVVVAMQVFAHVEKLDQGLDECFRVLKDGGKLVFSAHLVYPIVNDPSDYRRYTEAGWKYELEKRGFRIDTVETLGRCFTVLSDFIIMANKSMPLGIRHIGYAFYPFLSALSLLDSTSFVLKNKRLASFATGYFIIANK